MLEVHSVKNVVSNNISNPLISVILPVYNCENFVLESVDSILKQNYPYFELLIINDGSTDDSLKKIKTISDPRIRIINNRTNIGLIATLNKGIELSLGEYIARMDSDDVSSPHRFEIQLQYLLNNPHVGACGTEIETIGSKFKVDIKFHQADEIKLALLWHCPICHPSAMIRKSVLITNNIRYHNDYKHAEDYKLWTDLAKVSNIVNVPKKLLKYRLHDSQITSAGNELQWNNSNKIISEQLRYLGIDVDRSGQYLHQYLDGHYIVTADPYWEKKLINWCDLLIKANLTKQVYSHNLLQETLETRLNVAIKHYQQSLKDLSITNKVKYYIKKTLPEK